MADARRMGKVAVLMGGPSAEREISLMSGGGVLQAPSSTKQEIKIALIEAQGGRCHFVFVHHRRDGFGFNAAVPKQN